MGGLREARKNQSRAESRLDLAGAQARKGYAAAIKSYTTAMDEFRATGGSIASDYAAGAADAADAAGAAAGNFEATVEEYQPYMDLGKASTSAMEKLFVDPSSALSDPFYQAREKRQLDAVQTSAAARGKLFGGQTLLELMKTGGEFASAEWDKAAARYATGANIGLAGTAGYAGIKEKAAGMRLDAARMQLDAAKGSATVRSATQAGLADMQSNLAEMKIGKGNAAARMYENKAQLDAARSQFGAGMFSSWFGGSGPFGSATGASMKGGS